MKDVREYSEEIQKLVSIIKEYRGTDPVAVIENANKLETQGHKLNDEALIGYAAFCKGETYYLLNDVIKFYREMTSAMRIMQKLGEWDYVVMANNMLGIMSLNRGNAPHAMDYYLKALSICQKYKIHHLEWIVNMNMGAMYLNIEEYEKALGYIELAYDYVIQSYESEIIRDVEDEPSNVEATLESQRALPSAEDVREYNRDLTNIYIGMGKAYLGLEDLAKADAFRNKIEYDCMPYLSEIETIAVYCFKARLYNALKKYGKRNEVIRDMNDIIDTHIPIMDFFDDIYEYLSMLIDIEYYDDFFVVADMVEQLIKFTAIKNLERKLLSLKIRYYRKTNKRAEYMRSTVLFYELTEYMEQENHNMVSNMIDLRSDYDDLTAINIEFKKRNIALQKKSETDAITNIANRFGLRKHGKEALANAIRNNTSFAFEILDIDYFKQYNDNYGHQMGDKCLKRIANMMQKQKKYGKVFCARYGGDEFVIIYEEFAKDEVQDMASDLKNRIEKAAIPHEFSEAGNIVTISQGICYGMPQKGEKLQDYLYRADECLYKAKEISRNTVYIGDYTN